MQCPSCSADLPDDARFCIECGVDLRRPANTGATVALPRSSEGEVACRSCGAQNPGYAIFCVRCGQRMSDPALVSPPVRAPLTLPPVPQPLAPPTPPAPTPRQRHKWEGAEGVVFLVGLATLFLLRAPFWPTILIVAGLTAFVAEAIRGRYYSGLNGALWLFGFAFVLMVPRLWWPGMFALLGLSVLIDMVRRARGGS